MSIEVKQLSKYYGAQKALDEVSFEVKPGEILGFLGPNGAGKSTTMKIIAGLISPTSGQVQVCGYDVQSNSLETRRRIGYLAEQNPLYYDMYINEFLKFMGELSGIKGKFLKSRMEEMIHITGLVSEQNKKIGALSKGYKQRVGLAQALIHDPEVLILDEPTSGLDPNQLIEIRQLILTLGKAKTLIFSSHILPEVQAIADRIIIIDKGKIVADQAVNKGKASQTERVIVWVEFEGERLFELQALQQKFEGLHSDSVGHNQWKFTLQQEGDFRKALYEESVRQQVPIISLKKEEKGLEETFRSLTSPNVP